MCERACLCVCGQVAVRFTSPSLALLTLRPHAHPHHFPLLLFSRLPFIPHRVLLHSLLLTSPHWCTHCKIKAKDLLLLLLLTPPPSSPHHSSEQSSMASLGGARGGSRLRGGRLGLSQEQGILRAREGTWEGTFALPGRRSFFVHYWLDTTCVDE